MAQKRILVTGAAGNLGQDLLDRLALFERFDIAGTTSEQLNLTWEHERIFEVLDLLAPDVIINAGAYTQVDAAEADYETALRVNATAPGILAEWVKQHQCYLIHISTDYVFDGAKGALYEPQDSTNPINRYGESKLAGEKLIRGIAPEESVVIRTSWLFGKAAKNFVPFVIQAAQNQTPVRIASDQWGTPTWTGNLSKMILEAIDDRPTGILHGCSTGQTTRYQQALTICKLIDHAPDFMTAVLTNEFGFPAKRPPNTAMLSSFSSALSWEEATQRFLMGQGLLKAHV
jgi:dTDP-4-dehydrorhamnose reductase